MKVKNYKKKGQMSIGDLSGVGITLVITAIVLGIGATILASFQTAVDTSINTSNPATWNVAYNASGFGLAGLSTFGSYLPTIALVAVAAIVIGVVVMFFGRR